MIPYDVHLADLCFPVGTGTLIVEAYHASDLVIVDLG